MTHLPPDPTPYSCRVTCSFRTRFGPDPGALDAECFPVVVARMPARLGREVRA